MKKKHLIFQLAGAFISCLFCCSCYAAPSKVKLIGLEVKEEYTPSDKKLSSAEPIADREVSAFLGRERLTIIMQPDRVEAYQVDWRRGADKQRMTIQGYPVISRGRNLDYGQIKRLQSIITSVSSYDFSKHKRTRLRPLYILRFIRGNGVVDVTIDFNSLQWGFYYQGRFVEEDIGKSEAEPELKKIINPLF